MTIFALKLSWAVTILFQESPWDLLKVLSVFKAKYPFVVSGSPYMSDCLMVGKYKIQNTGNLFNCSALPGIFRSILIVSNTVRFGKDYKMSKEFIKWFCFSKRQQVTYMMLAGCCCL